MRIVIVCLVGISMCLSCNIIDNSMKKQDETSNVVKKQDETSKVLKKRDEKSKILKRLDEVSRIMKNYFRIYGLYHEFEIEGPFTIEQCKEHYVKRRIEGIEEYKLSEQKPEIRKMVLDRIKSFPNSQKFKDFVRPVENHKGNELYFFKSDIESWSTLNGKEGYVIVYKNELVGKIITAIN